MDNILKCFTNHELLSKVLRACLCSPVWFSLAVQTVEPDAREKRSQLLGILQCWCQNSVSRLSAGLQVCRSEHYTRLEKGGGGEETDWISTGGSCVLPCAEKLLGRALKKAGGREEREVRRWNVEVRTSDSKKP
ncbi:uncharacterized protein LOC123934513 isoform X1 [Meles meles]|uniref:uncharacterized protein LOC123934513 isoform X1 n=1 Tax=Meles meles TaxID=9662 RepID=UPI001E69D723|nr:uncharacterized protein LOC123934513 isoform X1 [Meles meles]